MKENEEEVNMLLAGDVGGTKTFIGLYDAGGPRSRRHVVRPRQVAKCEYSTQNHSGVVPMLRAFLAQPALANVPIGAATIGVAGPVLGPSARLTNVPWLVDSHEIASALGLERVGLLNDLESMAWGTLAIDDAETLTLQEGDPAAAGNIAVIAAGTGLGEAFLHFVNRRFEPYASEAGHADFAARNEDEIALLRDLIGRYGRAEIEQVLSGRGIVNLHRVTHPAGCPIVENYDHEAPPRIAESALGRHCELCVKAMDLFVDAYGAEAGNLVLRTVATGGVYVAGGIAPRILPALTNGRFLAAFGSKAPFEAMLAKVPVRVVLNPELGLLGAAVHAATHL